jgi:Na+/H+-dicarboxylate symporter
MVLNQVGLPVEGIGLIIGIDRLLDMVRTAVNVTGDATVGCIVARSEGAMDGELFDRDLAEIDDEEDPSPPANG